MRTIHRGGAALAVVALLLASCGRSDDGDTATETTVPSTADDSSATTAGDGTTTTAAPAGSLLDSGGFGDLENVCTEGDASGATDVGVTDTSIQIGTVTDKGFTGRPGLNREMLESVQAIAAWCNDHGGILGREVVVADRDAALTAFNEQITTGCGQDFAWVGGGAVFDDADNGARVACGMPNIPGFVVSPKARVGELQVQPVPNPVYLYPGGAYDVIAEAFPDVTAHYGIMTAGVGSTLTVRDQQLEVATMKGYTAVYNREYSAGGESNWLPFAQELQNAGVRILDYVGEPTNLSLLLAAMDQAGYYPDVILAGPNHYDSTFFEQAGPLSANTTILIRTGFPLFEEAADNQATQDYLDVMAQYAPDGKIAVLGAQAMSAFLLFAQSAAACGSELTRACLYEQASSVTEWSGGGLHAPGNPGANEPSDCLAIVRMTPDGFVRDTDLIEPNEGIFECGTYPLVELQNDYGVPR